MGNCKSLPGGNKGPGKKLTLAILGVDNAGKTVTAKGLKGESLDSVAPTIGFASVEFKYNKNDIVLYDLGGGKRIRGIWKNYFADVYGLIYVIDSSEPDRMEETREVLKELLSNPRVAGKPVLLLGNKQDCQGALDEIDICESLGLEEIVNMNKCPCRVETCTAISGQGKKLDGAIRQGFDWLIGIINVNYEKLHERVEKDVAEQSEQEAIEKQQKAERVRLAREAREREMELRGEKEETDEDDVDHGDPFKRVDINQLKQKELELKKKKKQKKAEMSTGGDSDTDIMPRKSYDLMPRRALSDDEDDSRRVPRQLAMKSTLTPRTGALPPIGRSPRPTKDGYGSEEENHSPEQKLSSLPWSNNRALRSGSPPLTRPPARLDSYGIETRHQKLQMPLAPLTPLAPLDLADSTKKKKKKVKKNQTVPSDDTEDRYDATSSESTSLSRGWGTPPGQRSLIRASRSPRLSTLEEPETGEDGLYSSSFNHRFGLEDGLPQLAQDDLSSRRRGLPNSEYDDGILT